MAVVSCPECSKKLKVADASVGKKVKCSCGQVFVAELEDDIPVRPPTKSTAVADKVLVACTECSAKLKVATTSLGKKMKCPKCASVFVAAAEEEEAPPVKKPAKPVSKSPFDDEDDPKPKPKAKGKSTKTDDDDALFAFAQAETDADAGEESEDNFEEEDAPKPKPKNKFQPKGKGKPPRPMDDDEDESPRKKKSSEQKEPGELVYPRRTFLNIFVMLILLSYIGIFVVCYPDLNLIKFDDFVPDLLKPPRAGKAPVRPTPGGTEVTPKEFEEKTLADYRKEKLPKLDNLPPYVVTVIAAGDADVLGLAFSPDGQTLASVSEKGIKLWSFKTLKDLKDAAKSAKSIALEVKSEQPILKFSKKGDRLALAGGGALKVWNVANIEKPTHDFPIDKELEALAFSQDGKHVVVIDRASAEAVPVLKVFDVGDPKGKETQPKLPLEKNDRVLLSADGDKLITVATGKVAIYDLGSTPPKELKSNKLMAEIQGEVRLSPDGQFAAAVTTESEGADSKIQRIKLDSAEIVELTKLKTGIADLRISSDGKYILYVGKDANNDEKYHLLDVDKKNVLDWTENGPVRAYAFSPGGVFVARSEGSNVHLQSLAEMITAPAPAKDNNTPTEKINPKKKTEDPKGEEKKDKTSEVKEKAKGDTEKVDPKKTDDPKVDPKKNDETKAPDEKKDKSTNINDKKNGDSEKIEPKTKDDKKVDDKKVDPKIDDEKSDKKDNSSFLRESPGTAVPGLSFVSGVQHGPARSSVRRTCQNFSTGISFFVDL